MFLWVRSMEDRCGGAGGELMTQALFPSDVVVDLWDLARSYKVRCTGFTPLGRVQM